MVWLDGGSGYPRSEETVIRHKTFYWYNETILKLFKQTPKDFTDKLCLTSYHYQTMAILLLTPYSPTNTHSIPALGEEKGGGERHHANNFSSSQARNIFRARGREEKYFFLPRSDPWPLKSNSVPAHEGGKGGSEG